MPLMCAKAKVQYTAMRVANCNSDSSNGYIQLNAIQTKRTWKGARWRAYDLRDDKGEAEPEPWALHEAPAARPGDEDERLTDDAHLQVQGRHHRVLVAPQRPHMELILQCGNNTV